MVKGCGCSVVSRASHLTNSTEMRFFWLPLSMMKWSGVPFIHICEWKRHYPSSSSSRSLG
jgi:hypothetical protein